MHKLREITVHVVEPQPRRFKWVLSEIGHDPGALREIQRAPGATRTYREAMAEGLLQLQKLVPDLDGGPRAEPHAKSSQKITPPKSAQKKPEAPEPGTRKQGFFGFGPVR